MADIEIKRGYEVLPDNNVRFGIRVINNSDSAILDVEVILDYSESLFDLEGSKVRKLDTIPPTVPRTAKFTLKPRGCIHKEEIAATIRYKDHQWKRYTLEMQPKEVHCVCPFLKEKSITRADFISLLDSGYLEERGTNFEGIGVDKVVDFLLHTCKNRLYRVDEIPIENGTILYLAGDALGEKAYYLLTAVVKEYEGVTQVLLRANSDKSHGLNGFLNEIMDNLRHLVLSAEAREIGIIKKEQVINIIDSVVQKTTFAGGAGAASVNIEGSVVQRTEIRDDGAKKRQETEERRAREEAKRKERESARQEEEHLQREEEERKAREESEKREREEQEKLRREEEEQERIRREEEEKKERERKARAEEERLKREKEEQERKILEQERRRKETEEESATVRGSAEGLRRMDEVIGKVNIETWKKVITTPGDFFRDMPTSGGYGEPLKFAVVNYIIAGIGLALVSLGSALFMIVAMPIIGIIGLFISGAILYVCFKIVGGSGSYEGTVRMLSYASAVNAVAWIPILGWIVALYAIYLEIVGGTFVHNITTMRSAIAIFVPIIVLVVIVVLLTVAMM